MAYISSYLAAFEPIGGTNGGMVWTYQTADSAATIAGAGYITDAAEGTSVAKGAAKGMQLADIVHVTQVASVPGGAATGYNTYVVSAIAATGYATLIKTATA